MDSTSQFRIKPSHHPYDSEPGQQFYSFNQPLQFSQSTQQQFQTFVKQINPHLLEHKQQYQYLNPNKIAQINSLLIKRRNNKIENQECERRWWRKSNDKSFGGVTKYGSLEKGIDDSYSDDDRCTQQKDKKQNANQNRVSLLQNSLKLQQNSTETRKNSKNGSGSQASSQISNKINSTSPVLFSQISSTRLAQKFSQMAPSPKEQSNGSGSQKKLNQFTENNNTRQYRIQGPDEVFAQLQLQKDQKKQKQKISKIVAANINNTKAMLNEISTKNNSNKVNQKYVRQQTLKKQENCNQDQNLKKFQPLISACLFRLPSLSSISTQPISTNASLSQTEQNFYHKYKYEITQNQLIINNVYNISFIDIKKIKIIHNEYNRPQLKINYSLQNCNSQFRESKFSQTITGNQNIKGLQKDKQKQKQGKQDGLVLYLCDCYQTVYSIYSWIIVSKLKNLGKQYQNIRSNTIRVNYKMSFDYQLSGIFLKKSKFLKNWQRRLGKISNFTLKSYRITPKSPQKSAQRQSLIANQSLDDISKYIIATQCTFEVEHIKQLWTRFQILQQKYLVMKMFKKNKMEKFQIAIPITNYCDWDSRRNWMFGLVGLLKAQS